MKCVQLLSVALFCSLKLSAQGIAVVELFTAQGCSSCPAADNYLSEIIQKAEKEGKPIYGLSFHVDYWNHVGWKDPYGSKEFTERQKTYYEKLPLRSVYTPQMIVNGMEEFVGSNRKGVDMAVDFALSQMAIYHISIADVKVLGEKLTLKYSLDKSPSDETLSLAVVERDVENFVPRGENSGKTLRHDNVVRAFKIFPLKREGELSLKIPALNSQKASVILYVQNSKWRVIAGAGMPLVH